MKKLIKYITGRYNSEQIGEALGNTIVYVIAAVVAIIAYGFNIFLKLALAFSVWLSVLLLVMDIVLYIRLKTFKHAKFKIALTAFLLLLAYYTFHAIIATKIIAFAVFIGFISGGFIWFYTKK